MTNPREWALNAGQDLGGTSDKGKVQDKRDEGNVYLYYSSLKSKLYKNVIKFLKYNVFMLSIHFSKTSQSGKDKLWNQKDLGSNSNYLLGVWSLSFSASYLSDQQG